MTDVEKLRFLLDHTITVAGMIYAQAIGSDLRKLHVSDTDNLRQSSISHASALVHDTVRTHADIARRRGTADYLDPVKDDRR